MHDIDIGALFDRKDFMTVILTTASLLITACSVSTETQEVSAPETAYYFEYSEQKDEFTRTNYTFANARLQNVGSISDIVTNAYFSCLKSPDKSDELTLNLAAQNRISEKDAPQSNWIMSNIQIRIGDNPPFDTGHNGFTSMSDQYTVDINSLASIASFQSDDVIMTRITAGSINKVIDAKIELSDPAIKRVFADCGFDFAKSKPRASPKP